MCFADDVSLVRNCLDVFDRLGQQFAAVSKASGASAKCHADRAAPSKAVNRVAEASFGSSFARPRAQVLNNRQLDVGACNGLHQVGDDVADVPAVLVKAGEVNNCALACAFQVVPRSTLRQAFGQLPLEGCCLQSSNRLLNLLQLLPSSGKSGSLGCRQALKPNALSSGQTHQLDASLQQASAQLFIRAKLCFVLRKQRIKGADQWRIGSIWRRASAKQVNHRVGRLLHRVAYSASDHALKQRWCRNLVRLTQALLQRLQDIPCLLVGLQATRKPLAQSA